MKLFKRPDITGWKYASQTELNGVTFYTITDPDGNFWFKSKRNRRPYFSTRFQTQDCFKAMTINPIRIERYAKKYIRQCLVEKNYRDSIPGPIKKEF